MSSIFDFFASLVTNLVHKQGVPPTFIFVHPENYSNSQLTAAESAALFNTKAAAEQHYLRIWVTRMLLADSIQWFSKYDPTVYSVVHLSYGDNDVDLSNVAGPKQLGGLQLADMNHSLDVNLPMTGLLPFQGGSVRLSCGLVQMSVVDLLSNFLNTVGDFANKLIQPQISAAISLASSVASGVQSLLGAGQADLLLYLDTTYTGVPGEQTLQSGFVFLSDEPSGSITAGQLWIIDGEPRIGATAAAAKPITGQNYVLLQIELLTTRDDWEQLKDIATPLKAAITAKIAGNAPAADSAMVQARTAVQASSDLTDADRQRVLQAINAQYAAA